MQHIRDILRAYADRFQPREKGSAEWSTFNIVRDERPVAMRRGARRTAKLKNIRVRTVRSWSFLRSRRKHA